MTSASQEGLDANEQAVFDCLNRRGKQLAYAEALDYQSDGKMPDKISAIGLDTNALKLIRQDPLLASALISFASSNAIPLVVPGQAVQEFWNNHRMFLRGSEGLERDAQSLASTAKKIAAATADSAMLEEISEIEDLVSAFVKNSEDARDPELYAKSSAVWIEIERASYVPHVPRVQFAELGNIRFATKTPPGFEDVDKYPRHLGDFFVWADFLLGLTELKTKGGLAENGRVLFYTDDAKQDWITSSKPHPSLLAEIYALTGLPLQLCPSKEIQDLVK